MNVAFLFSAESIGALCGDSVLNYILETGVLQSSNRHMRVLLGDILTFSQAPAHGKSRTIADAEQLDREVCTPQGFDRLIPAVLDATHGRSTVFCWVFQNITFRIADDLHSALSSTNGYLGGMGVDFSWGPHLALLRNCLIEAYRIEGRQVAVLYQMGSNPDPDLSVAEAFERTGFHVSHEDIGARRTVFDSYETLKHFQRVGDFIRVFSNFDDWSDEQSSELVLELEEIHPRLFDVLAAAARVVERAETTEEYAQAALSGRRFLESLADTLFPVQAEPIDGHDVGRSMHKNRLVAYLKEALTDAKQFEEDSFQVLIGELDDLLRRFNKGLHACANKSYVEASFVQLANWTHRVICLNRSYSRRCYAAYSDELSAFLEDFLGNKIAEIERG